MGKYFDYRDWEIEELCNSLRVRIKEAQKPLPQKVVNHYVSIRQRIGDTCYTYPQYLYFPNQSSPKTREEAEKFLNSCDWLEKAGENKWIELNETRYYDTKDGGSEKYHLEVHEYDLEEYEDGEYHVEYANSEIESMKAALYAIEKARVYMELYDDFVDNYSFGEGRFAKACDIANDKFTKTFTLDLPEGYEEDD